MMRTIDIRPGDLIFPYGIGSVVYRNLPGIRLGERTIVWDNGSGWVSLPDNSECLAVQCNAANFESVQDMVGQEAGLHTVH